MLLETERTFSLPPLLARCFGCRNVLAGSRWARWPRSLGFLWPCQIPRLPAILMVMCSKLCAEHQGLFVFFCFFCSSLYIPSVPSIVIVIRLVVLGQLAEGKSLSSTHQRKQLKLSLQVNSLFFFFLVSLVFSMQSSFPIWHFQVDCSRHQSHNLSQMPTHLNGEQQTTHTRKSGQCPYANQTFAYC